jgi:predicted transcriptional regulator
MNRTQSKKNRLHRARGAGGKARHELPGTVAMTLRGLRESVGRTQGELARKVSMTQPQLSRVEARNDHLISTLRRYVHALGGKIEVVAVVNGERIALQKV